MTPKEKAIELVKKFTLYLGTDVEGEEYYASELDAKRCALIAVDELIKLSSCFEITDNYYEKVKREINKLK